MKNFVLILSLNFILIVNVFSQEIDTVFVTQNMGRGISKTDTLIKQNSFPANFLFESAILPNTPNQMSCRGYGLYLDSANNYCVSDRYELVKDKVKAFSKTNDRLILEYQVVENCCQSMLYDMEIIGDSTLNLLYYSYGTHCACNCVYNVRFEVDISFLEKERKENFKKLKKISLNGELIFDMKNRKQTNMEVYDLFQAKLREAKEMNRVKQQKNE